MGFVRFLGTVSSTFAEAGPDGVWCVFPWEWEGGAPTGVGASWFYPFSGSPDGYVKLYWVLREVEAEITYDSPTIGTIVNETLTLTDVDVATEEDLMNSVTPYARVFAGTVTLTDFPAVGNTIVLEADLKLFDNSAYTYDTSPTTDYTPARAFWETDTTFHMSTYVRAQISVDVGTEFVDEIRSAPLDSSPTDILADVLTGNGGGDVQMYRIKDLAADGTWTLTITPSLWFTHGGKWDSLTGAKNPNFKPPY